MDSYKVKIYRRAHRDLERIYSYISSNLKELINAKNLVESIEEGIFSLEIFPERGSIRKSGIYADKDYRQLIIKDSYIIIYKVNKLEKEVYIITIRHSASDF